MLQGSTSEFFSQGGGRLLRGLFLKSPFESQILDLAAPLALN